MKLFSSLLFIALLTFASSSSASLSHRASANLGGMFWVVGYGLNAGAQYSMVFNRFMAFNVDGNYNHGLMALGQGPLHSIGLDLSLSSMIYNFGDTDFSKGIGVDAGIGLHYLADLNQDTFHQKSGSAFANKNGAGRFLTLPVSLGLFYHHLFDNRWFLKTGVKANVAQGVLKQFVEIRLPEHRVAKFMPLASISVGYSF